MNRVNTFELYSHATDPIRNLESVCAVAGTPKWSVSTRAPQVGSHCYTHTHTQYGCSLLAYLHTQEPNHSGGTHEPTHEDTVSTHHTNSLASSPPPDEQPVDIIISPKPFHKFSQGYMETLTDVGLTNCDRLARYIQLLEHLLAHAYFIPPNRIQVVVDTVLQVSDRQILYKFHSLLCQDLKLRSVDANLPVDYLQDTLYSISHTLSLTPTHLPSRVVLHYIALLKPPLSSSLSTKLLDMAVCALCVPSLDSLLSPTQAALSLVTSHSLARDLATRIQQLTSHTDKHYMLRCIPRLDLRLNVVQIILSQSFHGEHDYQPSTLNASLDDICQRHFTRRPYRPSGEPHDLCYFLSLLLLLVETWLLVHYTPKQCVGVVNETPPPNVQCVGHAVDLLTSRLLDDAFLTDELCSPNVWHQLQLLKAFSN